MKIYLDNCCLQRPLDNKSQVRVQLESEAILAILAICEKGQIELVASEVLEYELNKNPHPQRKAYVAEILDRAAVFVEVKRKITERAKTLESAGFKGVDALHVACAEAVRADCFCSCDEQLLKKAKVTKLHVRVMSPLELAEEILE
jgi:predicted nucleic acid-binding protein